MCCAIDGKDHQNPLHDDGSCMHCGRVPGPDDTVGPPLRVPTKEEIEAIIGKKE